MVMFVRNIPTGKNILAFSDVPLHMEIFRWNESKSRVPFTSQRDFQEAFVKGKRP